MGEVTQHLRRFEEIGESLSDPNMDPDKMMKILEEQGRRSRKNRSA